MDCKSLALILACKQNRKFSETIPFSNRLKRLFCTVHEQLCNPKLSFADRNLPPSLSAILGQHLLLFPVLLFVLLFLHFFCDASWGQNVMTEIIHWFNESCNNLFPYRSPWSVCVQLEQGARATERTRMKLWSPSVLVFTDYTDCYKCNPHYYDAHSWLQHIIPKLYFRFYQSIKNTVIMLLTPPI